MPWWGYLAIATAAYLVCALTVYLIYCSYLQHGKRGIAFAAAVVVLNIITFRLVRAWKGITGKRLWWEKHRRFPRGTKNEEMD